MLVLDFGGQYSQLIARRVREARVYWELARTGSRRARSRAPQPVGADPLRRPGLGLRERRPRRRSGGLPARRAAPRHLLRHAADGAAPRRRGRVERRLRVRQDGVVAGESVLFRDLPAEQTVWMSHSDSVVAPPPGSHVTAARRRPRSPGSRTRRAACMRSSSTQRSCTPRTGRRSSRTSSTTSCGAPPAWTPAAVIEEQVERIRAQVGGERVICGLSGGVDSAVAALLVHKAVGTSSPACSSITGCCGRTRPSRSWRRSGGTSRCRSSTSRRRSGSSRRLAGVTDPEDEAEDRRRGVHPGLRGGGRRARRRALPRPGDALPGRDRVGGARSASPRRSSRTTTSAGSRPTCAWSSSSRCASCSRTRCAASARSSGCRSASSGAIRSPAPASRSASSAT